MDLFLIDAIGPFFRGLKRRRINWSKIPFAHLKLAGEARRTRFDRIRADLALFTAGVKAVGYNALSLDDVAHLADHPWYEPEIRAKIGIFQEEFRSLFRIVTDQGMGLYLTMDMLSLTPALKARLRSDNETTFRFVRELLAGLFAEFPEVSGVILRIGESDGLDVRDQFRSELCIHTPEQLNHLLRNLLPVFEANGRRLILRTWTVGAYQVGDFIWHQDTLARTLDRIDSPAFILSMKYGETDFFRYLRLNPQFFATGVQKIIELQARREYEGCGEYPSFIGSDYEQYARELGAAQNMVGISVWCQTGGWVPFRRLAFLDDGAIWTEINAFVTLQIFRYGVSARQAVVNWCTQNEVEEPEALEELLALSEEVVKELLYIPEFARQELYFRRIRIPPLLSVYWNTMFINHSMSKIMENFVSDHQGCIASGWAALEKIDRMWLLADRAGLPTPDIEYMRDTFSLLALSREYYFLPFSEEIRLKLKQAKKEYKQRYPPESRFRYKVKLSFKPFRIKRRFLGWVFDLVLRRQRGYRLIDHLLTLNLLSLTYWLVRNSHARIIPKFCRKRAMGLDTIFR